MCRRRAVIHIATAITKIGWIEQPVSSLVVLAVEDAHWRPRTFRVEAPGTVMGIWFATAKLLDHTNRSSELEASNNPFAWITLAHLRTQQARHDPDALYAAKVAAHQTAVSTRLAQTVDNLIVQSDQLDDDSA